MPPKIKEREREKARTRRWTETDRIRERERGRERGVCGREGRTDGILNAQHATVDHPANIKCSKDGGGAR